MGFAARLSIILPVPYWNGHTVWKVQQVFDFGDITRFEKLHMPGACEGYDDHARAGICVTRVMLNHFAQRLREESLDRSIFAPPILIFEDGTERHWQCEAMKSEPAADHIDHGNYCDSLNPNPYALRKKISERHNKLRSLPDQDLLRYIEKQYVIEISPLTMWASCEEVVGWLDAEAEEQTPLWEELEKKPLSLVHARAWIAYLRQMIAANAKVLLIFPNAFR